MLRPAHRGELPEIQALAARCGTGPPRGPVVGARDRWGRLVGFVSHGPLDPDDASRTVHDPVIDRDRVAPDAVRILTATLLAAPAPDDPGPTRTLRYRQRDGSLGGPSLDRGPSAIPSGILRRAGYRPVVRRTAMEHDLAIPESPPPHITWITYRPRLDGRFQALFRASFRGSLDRAYAWAAADPRSAWAAARRDAGAAAHHLWFSARTHRGQDVGLCLLEPPGVFETFVVRYLAVMPSARGAGLARLIAAEAVRRAAAAAGVPPSHPLRLTVDIPNRPAVAAYRAAGFHPLTAHRLWVRPAAVDPVRSVGCCPVRAGEFSRRRR